MTEEEYSYAKIAVNAHHQRRQASINFVARYKKKSYEDEYGTTEYYYIDRETGKEYYNIQEPMFCDWREKNND